LRKSFCGSQKGKALRDQTNTITGRFGLTLI